MNWSEFKQQVERWLYNFSTLFSFFTQFVSSTAGDATWSYRKEDGTIEDKTVPNVKKILSGDSTQRFKVADAVEGNEAVSLNQIYDANVRASNWTPSNYNQGIGKKRALIRYFTNNNEQNKKLHFVLDIKNTEHRMFCIEFQGYAVNQPLAINCIIAGYMYADNGILGVNSTQDLFEAYINSQGNATIKYTGNHYYFSAIINAIEVGNSESVRIIDVQLSENDL